MSSTTKHTNYTKGKIFAGRCECFPLSAHQMGGEGRGEVGSSTNSIEFNAKTQRRKDAKGRNNLFAWLTQARDGARVSARFNDHSCNPQEVKGLPLFRTLKRRERRVPFARLAPLRLCAFALNRFPHRFAFVCLVYFAVQNSRAADLAILKPADFTHHVSRFNAMEDENFTNTIANADSWSWLQKEIPFFECSDREVEEMYYFRWWSFRKHLVQTTNGWVITEFLTPVRHAGVYNTISCAAGFHLAEGRWLHDQKYLDDYTLFWLRGNAGQPQPHFHKFSSWFESAAYDRLLVNGDKTFPAKLLADFVADYHAWENERLTPGGLFWQYDVRDGMEESISGSRTNKNLRPTINSYMFANARAIAAIARLAGNKNVAGEFDGKAARLKTLVQEKLWNEEAKFFEARWNDPPTAGGAPETGAPFANVREELGFIPWMFGLADDSKFAGAWRQLDDTTGFNAPAGLATAERRHPQFRSHGVGTCEWDGAVWPFATSQTLYALANVLRDHSLSFPKGGEGRGEETQFSKHPLTPTLSPLVPRGERETGLSRRDYFDAFLTYVHSQHADGKPYLGEYLDEVTGEWINGKGGRSRYYNHSTFADLLITGVVGLRPRADDTVEIYPLLPANTWDWFCLDGVKYHGHMLTILWDKDGMRYGRGAGLRVLADGNEIARADKLERVTGKLP